MTESLHLQGTLKGHNGWVTQIATNPNYSDMVLSSSRDRSLILWKLSRSEHNLGLPQKRLLGHNHFVSDIAISSDGHFALSGSWDRSLRLWDLGQGTSTRQFVDHKKDVMSVAFSADNRQIVSGSRDKSLKLWNTLAHCKFTMQDEGHADWVSCVRFSPNIQNPIIVSCGWDKKVKVWSLTNCKVRTDHAGHSGCLNSVTISPDGSLCASGGQDSKVMLWDLNEDKHLYTLENKDVINALCFSPNRYWLCAAVGPYIKIWVVVRGMLIAETWTRGPENMVPGGRGSAERRGVPGALNTRGGPTIDLEGKLVIDELCPEVVSQYSGRDTEPPQCLCMSWSGDGQTLFAGYSDSIIRAWQVIASPSSS
uniref:Small ribosomal subunit protein RACK1 n=1 Tax=Timema genevievae TaxID=629358 RepID=A0A7R9PL89_TIMGE|nr:unnamed protein product [Timema genevievae]